MIKLDIVNRVAERTGVPKMKAEQAVDALFHSMKEALARGERIELRGFGVFVVKPRKRGVGRNPRTGEEVAIPSGKTIRFKPGKELQAHGFEAEDGDHEHDTDAPPQLSQAGLRDAAHLFAEDRDQPTRRLHGEEDETEQRRFARPRRSGEELERARLDGEGQVAENLRI